MKHQHGLNQMSFNSFEQRRREHCSGYICQVGVANRCTWLASYVYVPLLPVRGRACREKRGKHILWLGLSFRFRRLLGSRLFVPFRSTRGSFFLLVWTKGDPFSSPGSTLLPGFVPIGWCLTTSPDDGRGGFVPIHAPERSTPGWNSVGRMRPWSFLRNDARAGTFQVDSPQPQLCRSRETNGACPLAGDPIHSIGEDRTISST